MAGVTALVVHVDVHVPADMRRPDEEIAQAIGDALRWNTSVPADTIRVTVEDGAVTLRGRSIRISNAVPRWIPYKGCAA